MRNKLRLLLLRTEQGAVVRPIQIFTGMVVFGIAIIALAVWNLGSQMVPEPLAEPVKILDDSEVCIAGVAQWPHIMNAPEPFILCGTIVQKHFEVEGEARLQGGGV